MDDLQSQIDRASKARVLLVGTDYDETLAPIVSDPTKAEPHRAGVVALKALWAMPQTHVALISGRPLEYLKKRFGDLEGLHLVGSHGSEIEGDAPRLSPDEMPLLQKVEDEARRISAKTPGTLVEQKPAGVAFHYRNAPEEAAAAAASELLQSLASAPGIFVRHGKKVVEFSVVKADKGAALRLLRQRVGASVVVFIGDDITDEDAFATLAGPDIGIKVGPGPTAAKYRVQNTPDVMHVLTEIAEKRAAWLAGAR